MSTDALAPTFLVVDDDAAYRERLARALTARGCVVRTAGDVSSALAFAREESPERALVDLRMPGGSGLDLVTGLQEIDPTTRVVVLTGYGSIATAVEALRRGACHYLQKPVDADQILAAFEPGGEVDASVSSAAEATPSLARVEWEHMQRVLHDAGGNISEAARRLGLHRRSLQRKLFKNPPPV
jgi:two-component system response regulator RegA